ncbi:MAG: restriction endonuclease subunit S [Oscillospiraceae bacterium]|nr:restriction endonuclease subunit S [Oscillospiraceae bacterium]
MANFLDVFEDVTKQGKKIPTNDYLESGPYPIIDQGQEYISGYYNNDEGLFSDVPAIVFGDHTRVLKYVDTPFFLGADGVKLLKAKDITANYKYLYYALCNAKIPNTGYNRHFKWLKEVDIPMPDPDAQRQIAATLDQVTHTIDLCNALLEKLDLLVKARFVEMFDDIEDRRTIAEICSIITDGTHQPPKFVENGIPFLFVSNIVTNEITYNAEKFISEETYNELYKRTPIEIGDIVLSTVGSYGHPAVVKSNKRFLFQRHIAYLKPISSVVNSVYLHSAILSNDVQRQIDERVKGIAQKTLNLSEIRKVIVPIPSLETQEQFAAFVEHTDKSKLAVQQVLERAETLKKALMQEYFG